MANRLLTGTTCSLGAVITFVADDALVMLNPLNRIYQLGDGTCITLTATGATTSDLTNKVIVFGPYTSCTQCITPVNSAGIESINCKDCGTGTVTASTMPHAVYTNAQNRAISQINTVTLGGPNGLNN
jgi:DNA/RNA endonuclease YhcR with UshA esterase domain